jgi:hypothetical protein
VSAPFGWHGAPARAVPTGNIRQSDLCRQLMCATMG